MIVVFLGPPGAGKGTQCKMVADRYGLQHLSSGDILRRHRKEGTELGLKAQSYMDQGALVPDELIVAMMVEEMQAFFQNGRDGGFILDGFPRTIGQAEELDAAFDKVGAKIDLVLNLQVDDDKLELRITGRRSCPRCGAAYHVRFNPPVEENICDAGCGELVQRPDDTSEVVRSRIETYHEQTAPLVKYYRDQGILRHVDGNVDIEQVTEALCEIIDRNAACLE